MQRLTYKLYFILLIIISLVVQKCYGQASLSLSLSTRTINANSAYNFLIIDPVLQSNDGTITIGFPSGKYTALTSISCYNTVNPTQIYICTVSGLQVLVTFTRATFQNSYIQLSIATVKNPSSKQSLSFSYTFTSGGSTLSSATSDFDILTPDVLASCSVSFSPSTVNTQSIGIFTITTKNALDSNGSITLTFPSLWNHSISSAYSPLPFASVTCNKVSGSVLKSVLSCDLFGSKISLGNALATSAPAGSTIVFNITRLRSPPTTATTNMITIGTQTSSGNQVDQSSCLITAVSEQTLSLSSTSTFVVGNSSTLSLTWISASPLKVGDVITITLPTSFMSFFQYGSGQLKYNGTRLAFFSASVGNSSLQEKYTISSLFLSDTQIGANLVLQFSNLPVLCLIDTSSRSVTLGISRSGFGIATGTYSLTPNPNILRNVTITADNRIVSGSMSLTFSFTIWNSLSTTSFIKIQIPTSISITNTTPSCTISSPSSPTSVASSITCSITGNEISLTSFLVTTLGGTSTLVLNVLNAFKNPETTQPTNPFIIKTTSSSASGSLLNLIDQNTAATYTAQAGTIGNLSITPSSFVVGNQNIYTLDYTIIRPIKSGSTISIVLPSQISLGSSPSYTYSVNNGAFTLISPSITTSTTTTLVFSGIITTALTSGANIKIKFNKLVNPTSLQTSSSFKVYINYNGFPIEMLETGLTITMTTLTTFREVLRQVINPTNGAAQDYTFYLKPLIPINTNGTINIEIQDNTNNTNQISLSSTITCSLSTTAGPISTRCTSSGSLVTLTLLSPISDSSGSTQYTLIISSYILARTPKTSSAFKLTSFTAAGFGVQTTTVDSIINTKSNSISSIVLDILSPPSQLNQKEQIKLTIQTYNGLNLLNGEYFVIYIPLSFTYVGSAVTNICTNMIFNCTIYNSNNNAIKVAATSSYTTIGLAKDFSITLDSQMYVSPLSFTIFETDYFLVRTYTSNNLIIDDTDTTKASTKAAFYRTCSNKCKTCPATNTTFCLTCYLNNTGVIPNINFGGFNTMTADGNCVDVCGSGYYNSSSTCFPCQIPCATCTSATACNTCSSGYFYTTINTTIDTRCRSTCPTGTYANSITRTCELCSTQCAACSNVANNCTACPSLTYLSGSQCILFCPDGTFENTASNTCSPCDVGCLLTCQTSAITCDFCKSGYYRINSSSLQCVNSCPTGSVKNNITNICSCSSSCATCSGTIDTCLSCTTGLILYLSTCISQCPSQTYQPLNSATCVSCTFTNCSRCNQTQCLTCMTNFLLSSGSCVTSCPLGTRPQNSVCVACSSSCAVCPLQNTCTQCFTGFLLQGNSCVTSCSAGFFNFNATSCVSGCPIGYVQSNGRCQIDNSTINNSTNGNNTVVIDNTTTVGRIIPFPYTIAYVLVIGVSVGMRCLYPSTLLPSVIMSFGSILEIMSIITLIIVSFLELQSFAPGLGIILGAAGLIYASNIVALAMILKVLNNDTKYSQNIKKKPCPNTIIRIISICTYHKFHQIIFSNIFGVKIFCNKVDYVRRLYPFNVLLIISLVLSLFIVIGSSLIGYEVQSLRLASSTFIQSVDCIIIVVLNVIPTILVLRRKDVDYQQDINDREAKRYQTQDQLNMNNDSAGIQDVFIQDGGDAYGKPKLGQSRKNYFYQNSKKSQSGQDPYENPLDKKRVSTSNPINAQNFNGDKSSQSLFFGGDKSKIKSNVNPLEEVSEQIQQIVLEQPTRDNLMPPSKNIDADDIALKKKEDTNSAMLNYTGYDLDPKLLALNQNSDEFKKLPSQTKAKIRLAKANLQINKNSSKLKNKTNQNGQDVQEIQLSPKKNKDKDESIIKRNSLEDPFDTSGAELLNDSIQKQMNSESPKSRKKSKSKSKSKSKQKNKNKQSNSLQKRYGDGKNQQEKDEADKARMVRNQSQQIKKKDLANSLANGTKTTKSQNIKKKKKKQNNQIKVQYNGNQNNSKQQVQKNDLAINDEQFDEDEPTLPVFKHKSKSKGKRQDIYATDSDGLNQDQGKIRKGNLSNRKTSNLQDYHLNNLRGIKGQRTIPNQQPDDLPQLHSSQQLSNLVIVNRTLKNKKSNQPQFSNDDSSIYKKIYNDDTETLKSVQGDNMFGNQVSPSQFNIQNQRFQDTSASNDMPVPATFEDQDLEEGGQGQNDGFDQHGSHIRRYQSTHHIDYDSVLSKRINNDRIKQLQKIYLPRLEVIKPKKKKK